MYTTKVMLRNYLVEVISNKLCVQITYINYNIPKIVICGNKYFLEIESLGREHPVRNRSPAGLVALARELACTGQRAGAAAGGRWWRGERRRREGWREGKARI